MLNQTLGNWELYYMALAALKPELLVDEKIEHLEAENAQMRDVLRTVSKELSAFGLDMAAIAGAIEGISASSIEEVKKFDALTTDLTAVKACTGEINASMKSAREVTQQVGDELGQSQQSANDAIVAIQELISDVSGFNSNMEELNGAMESVRSVKPSRTQCYYRSRPCRRGG